MKKSFFNKTLVCITTSTLIFTIFSSLTLNVVAEETQAPQELPDPEIDEWFIDANGTYFEITNSSYLNVTLTSSENVHVYLVSVPGMVSFHIESNCSANSTLITLSGFEASNTYYRYQNGNLEEEFTTDTDGSYMYTQDITTHNHVSIKEEISTIYIQSDGSINPSTAPIIRDGDYYTLTGNVYEPIYIQKAGITLDGNGFTVQGSGTDYGIYCYKVSYLTIKNLNIMDFSFGILLYESHGDIITDNTVTNCYNGIYLYHSIANDINNNTISYCTAYAFHLCWGSNYNLIDGNILSGNNNGIYFRADAAYNDISHNIISNANYGIYSVNSAHNTIKNNTISESYVGIYGHTWFASNSMTYNTFLNNTYCIYMYHEQWHWNNPGYNSIINNTFSESYAGLYIARRIHHNTISGNTISNNDYGLLLTYWTNYNVVTCNTIINNDHGIHINQAYDGTFYYNNIIDNTYQFIGSAVWNTWDNGAGEGNYWSDYIGLDDGSNGRIAGDGIGDTNIPHPYINQGNGYYQIDNYPLMTPWSLNDPPIANAGGPYEVDEGTEITFNASGSSDPDEDELQYRWDFENDSTWDTGYSTDPTATNTWYDDYSGDVSVEVYDGEETDIATATVTVNNVAPIADAGDDKIGVEPSPFTFTGSHTDPGTADTHTYEWDFDYDGITFDIDTTGNGVSNTWDDDFDGIVALRVTDDEGGWDIDTCLVTVYNVAPTADAGEDKMGVEPSPFTFTGSHTDPGIADTHIYDWDFDYDGITFDVDATGNGVSNTWEDDFDGTVALRVTDDDGGWSIDTCSVIVSNVAPTITSLYLPIDPLEIGTVVDLTATFTDPGVIDTHTASIDWGDGNVSSGSITGSGGSYTVTDSWAYGQAGVYTITLTIEDDDSGSDTEIFQYVVIYNPSGGFVSGGGWINSPEGAYTPDPDVTGKAIFGFVSKYNKGQQTPIGNTRFKFNIANMDFDSDEYEWLVIAGAKAMYKGTGTINGAGNYGFILSAIDEDLTPSTDVDLFRIKIWDKDNNDELIYDNQLGGDDDEDPTTEIGGGNIKIHKGS